MPCRSIFMYSLTCGSGIIWPVFFAFLITFARLEGIYSITNVTPGNLGSTSCNLTMFLQCRLLSAWISRISESGKCPSSTFLYYQSKEYLFVEGYFKGICFSATMELFSSSLAFSTTPNAPSPTLHMMLYLSILCVFWN